jgi:hypothetical protein
VRDFLENYAKVVFGIHHYYAMFEVTKSRGQIHVHILAMLGKKSSIIELHDLVYRERHDVKKQAQVADDWIMNAFGLTSLHPGSSTGGVLDRAKIGKQEGTCGTPLSHLNLKKCWRLQIKTWIYATCVTVVQWTIAVITVYIIKKAYQEIG